jgi:hypothetical protein
MVTHERGNNRLEQRVRVIGIGFKMRIVVEMFVFGKERNVFS